VECVELDKKIDHYRLMAARMTDQAMLDGIKKLIDRAKAQKTALHPDQTQQGRLNWVSSIAGRKLELLT
jgi:hypothetical protein